jgi:hypothetical protein
MQGRNPVELTSARLRQSGINRQDKRRALTALEAAALIHVEKRGRKNPLVHLLEKA